MQSVSINDKEFRLWGQSGGELELVSVNVESRKRSDGTPYEVAIIRFTDHDAQALPEDMAKLHNNLIDGYFYEMIIPFFKG